MMTKKRSRVLWLLLLIGSMLITACSTTTDASQDSETEHMGEDDHDDADHTDHGQAAHIHAAAPAEFADLVNPVAEDEAAIAAGAQIFATSCVVCHGPEGKGDGAGATTLDPKPADLSDGMMMETLSDGYLFWRVTKGGAMEPFNSAMPAWETVLNEEQRWQVVSYIRTLSENGHGDDDHEEDDHDN